ncbi:MAG: hypothetical protein ABI877_20590 [Gemmatimonadaceae bacterium]
MSPSIESSKVRDSRQRLALIASWLVVGIPAAWGVSQVVMKSMALFK